MAPYCAIPRDYLSDTPLLRAMGFLVSQHDQLGAIPPPPFLSVSPLESMRSGGAIPPPKGYLSDTCAIPYENKAMGAIPPSAILSRKGSARYGGVSRTGPLRARLQKEVDTKYFLSYEAFLCKSPEVFIGLLKLACGSERILQNSRHISHKICLQKIKKNSRTISCRR